MTWTLLFIVCAGLQIAYLIALRIGVTRAFRSLPVGGPPPPVSVIVAARNEADRIEPLLQALVRQTHPAFEVVVVDDGSTDATPEIVNRIAAEYPVVRLVSGHGTGKKRALTDGIRAARHDLLAFTDADGRPGPDWVRRHAEAHAASEAESVLVGYGPLRTSGGWAGALIRFDADLNAFLAAGAIGLGRGFMAAGRNLSYPRAVFERVGGHSASEDLLSGDDDLFVQSVRQHQAAELRYLPDPATFVPSDAPRSLRAWLRQKTRHTSAGRRFLPSVKVHLALFHISPIALWVAPWIIGWTGFALLATRLAVLAWAVLPAWRRFDSMDLLPRLVVLDFLYAFYNVFVPPYGLIVGPRRW